MTLQKRFDEKWEPVTESGCWIWIGSVNKETRRRKPYGRIKVAGVVQYAHRVSYELHVGPIPEDHVVCHCCDNPYCVNPDHLFIGTQSENMVDKFAKGRHCMEYCTGENHHNAKLTSDQVDRIRASNKTNAALADKFGVHPTTISNIRNNKVWKN